MPKTYILVALALATAVRGGDVCYIRDSYDRLVAAKDVELLAGILPSTPSPLPTSFQFVTLRPVRVLSNCAVHTNQDGDRTSFTLMEPSAEDCVIRVSLEGSVPECRLSELFVRYAAPGSPPAFVRTDHAIEERFPVPKDYRLNRERIHVLHDPNRSVQVRLSTPFEDVKLVRVDWGEKGTASYDVVTTRKLYLMGTTNLTLVASDGSAESEASLQVRLSEGSVYPNVEFEKSFYETTLSTWNMEVGKDIYLPETINLRHRYPSQTFSLRNLNDHNLHFRVSNPDNSSSLNLHLSQLPSTTQAPPPEILILLEAAATDPSGHESTTAAALRIQLVGNVSRCGSDPVLVDTNSTEDLTIAVTVLSGVVIILLLLLIYGYFKYVCVRRPMQTPGVCKKCSNPTVKHRRPTPRRISEFPYPLDNLPPPLETLAETDVDEETEGKSLEVKVVLEKEPPKKDDMMEPGKARKRSMTFRESDEESRQNREALAEAHDRRTAEEERKLSQESKRKVSTEDDERRRRKSSSKMYHSLT